eukprot:m.1167360 g.1167360  ORF g.1167360 m.1167360 type:complete len:90 (-) comp24506_c0_seq32:3763-4032(-)
MAEEISTEALKQKLIAELPAAHVEISDTSVNRCGAAFEAIIVSDTFEGKSLLARHRLVNKILEKELASIHAFSQKTYTTEQFAAQSEKQ